jgi:Tol biopolymer transport system component
MTDNRSKAVSLMCLLVTTGLLLLSCDKVPTQPRPPLPPPPDSTIQRSTGPIAFVSDRDGTYAIYLANEDGSAVTRLANGQTPAWSRDGRRLAFSRSGIWVINADGSGLRQVTGDGREPTWSPDGRTIVFSNLIDSLDFIEADGTNRRTLYDRMAVSGESDEPAWSPDGLQIAFGDFAYGFCDCGLWLIGADGSNPHQVPGGDLSDAWSPAWSPDGAEIAFISRAGVGVVRPDGSGRRFLHAGDARDVDWTSDGRLVFVTSGSEGRSRIFVSDGGSARQLIPDATSAARPGYGDFEVAWRR